MFTEDSPDRQDPLAKYWGHENIPHNLQATEHAFILQDAAWFQKIEISLAAPDCLELLVL